MLTTGRLMAQYQSGTQTRRHPSPDQTVARPEAQLHPDLARRLEIASADIVELRTRRGSATFHALVNREIRSDSIFVPFHWGGASNANLLTSALLDPHSKMPSFKACAVNVRRVGSPADTHLLDRPHHSGESAVVPPVPRQPRQPSRQTDPHMISKNLFLQGIFPFEGAGLSTPVSIHSDLVTVVLVRDGVPMRYFPMGAKGDVNVPLRVVEDIEGGSVIELQLFAEVGICQGE